MNTLNWIENINLTSWSVVVYPRIRTRLLPMRSSLITLDSFLFHLWSCFSISLLICRLGSSLVQGTQEGILIEANSLLSGLRRERGFPLRGVSPVTRFTVILAKSAVFGDVAAVWLLAWLIITHQICLKCKWDKTEREIAVRRCMMRAILERYQTQWCYCFVSSQMGALKFNWPANAEQSKEKYAATVYTFLFWTPILGWDEIITEIGSLDRVIDFLTSATERKWTKGIDHLSNWLCMHFDSDENPTWRQPNKCQAKQSLS